MNAELEAILNALLESRKILEAKLDAVDTRLEAIGTRLEAVAVDVAAIKEQIGDMNARDQYFMQKTGELEAELFVLKQRQKA